MMAMRKLGCGVTVAVLLTTPALAGPTRTSTAALAGTAPTVCTLSAPTLDPTSNGAALSGASTTSATVTFSGFVSPATAAYIPGVDFTLVFDGMCNYPSNYRIQSQNGRLTTTTPVVGGTFVTGLDYSAGLHWRTTSSTLQTNGTAGLKGSLKSLAGAYSGEADLEIILTTPINAPLVSGDFTDHLTVQIGAAL